MRINDEHCRPRNSQCHAYSISPHNMPPRYTQLHVPRPLTAPNPPSHPQERAPQRPRQLHPPQPGLGAQEQLAVAPEAEIRAPAPDRDLADQHPPGTPHLHAVAAPGVHVARRVALDAVREARRRVREDALVGQEGRAAVRRDVVGVYRRRPACLSACASHAVFLFGGGIPLQIVLRRAVTRVGVGDIHDRLIRTKRNAIRPPQPIGQHAEIPRRGIEPVHGARQARPGPELLVGGVARVGEPDAAVARDHDVVRAVEVPAVEARHDGLRALAARHVPDAAAARLRRALRADQDAVDGVVDGAVGHVDAGGRTHLDPVDGVDVVVTVGFVGAVQLEARDEDGGEVGGFGGLEEVGGDVELLVRGEVDAGFVEEGVFGRFGGEEERVRRGGAGYGGEGGVILQDCDGVGGE